MSINYDYSPQEILKMYQELDSLISQKSTFEKILTEKVKEGKIVFSGSETEYLH